MRGFGAFVLAGLATAVLLISMQSVQPVFAGIVTTLTTVVGATDFMAKATDILVPSFPLWSPVAIFLMVFVGSLAWMSRGGSTQ